MAIQSETPYGAFNFLVSIGGVDPQDAQAGFSEISGLSMEVQVIEYRAGNDRTESPVNLPGLTRYGPVTLKRGLIGSLDLYEWITESAQSGPGSRRNVTIHLLNDEQQHAFTWKLRNAWVSKYSMSDLDASSNDIAMET
ncbi:MAG: phage tail protein, partial [Candidatus Thiodiazotropha endolucinida]